MNKSIYSNIKVDKSVIFNPNIVFIKNTMKNTINSEVVKKFEEQLNLLIGTNEDLLITENFDKIWISSGNDEEYKKV